MATDFVSRTDAALDTFDATAFVRFFGGTARGTCFEFGTMSNFETVRRLFELGEAFVPVGTDLDSDPTTAAELDALVVAGRVTFGEFPVTVALGSGALFRFTVEQ